MEEFINKREEHEKRRQQLWIDVFLAYMNTNKTLQGTAVSWADGALQNFDEKFKLIKEN